MYTVNQTFSYHSQKFICACVKSSVDAHGSEIRGKILNGLKLPYNMQGNGWFATDSQGPIRMSDDDPRSGTFHQMQVTVGDTIYSVKEVLNLVQEKLLSS